MLDGEGPLKAEPFYYQLDHLGTPQELTSYGGEILWSARYRAYGNVARLEVAEIDNPLRFQGQYYDTETGLHYNRHRYYNPNTGRFLNPDPIKLAGGLNHYQYVPNPTGWVDPLGLSDVCPQPVNGGTWKFNPEVDVDLRTAPGTSYQQMTAGLDEAFERTKIPKSEFEVTKWGKDQYGKSFPTEWRVLKGKIEGQRLISMIHL
ncbi:RHS domain-containing protein [Pseudomonas sp. ADPe]|nr:RHS domain-containing protein [Pseudomonas sp. ADPe]